MELKETDVKLRRLKADEGKIIISKETQKDENGIDIPIVRAKEIYLGKEDREDNYVEVDEEESNG